MSDYEPRHDTLATPDAGTVWEGTAFEGWTGEGDATVDGWGAAKDLGERGVDDSIEVGADGVASFAAVRHRGWHNLGTVYDKPVSAEQMLIDARADYGIALIEDAGVVRDEQGNILKVLTHERGRKIARVDDGEITATLGTATPKYRPFDNRETFLGFGDALTELTHPNAAACGVLEGGRKAFMCWKLSREILVGGLDAADLWLLVSTSHDGSWPLQAAVTPLRTVCINTCRWNIRHAISKWRIKHTRHAALAVEDARRSLNLTYAYADQWESVAQQMIQTQLTTDKFRDIVSANFGPDEDAPQNVHTKWAEKEEKLVHLFSGADTQANIRGTAWAGVQAIGEFQDWTLKTQTPGWEGNADGLRFMRSLWDEKTVFGGKQAALEVFAEYAGVSI